MNSILVPVRPHVLKYLQTHLGKNYFLSESDHFGLLLFQLLRRPGNDKRRDHKLEEFESRWEVAFGAYDPDKYGLQQLTGKTVHQFDRFVHSLVISELHGFVDVATEYGNEAKWAIQVFMRKYGFREEDVAYDTLLKSWQRFVASRRAAKKPVPRLSARQQLKDLDKKLRKLPPPQAPGPGFGAPAPL